MRRRLLGIALSAALAAVPVRAEAATFSVTVTPSSTGFTEDVTSPGSGWTFDTRQAWFPSAWTDAYTYHTSGCLAVAVATTSHAWSLNAYYTASPSASLNVALAQAGTGTTCSAPSTAGQPIANGSGSATTLLSGQNGTQTVNFYVVVQPTTAVTSPVTIMVTFTAQ